MKTLEIRVKEVISVADIFGEQIKKTFEKIERVFDFCVDSLFKQIQILFGNPGMRARPPTVAQVSPFVNPPNMVYFTVLGGFILGKSLFPVLTNNMRPGAFSSVSGASTL